MALYFVRQQRPGGVLWEQVSGLVGDAAAAEAIARRWHEEAGGAVHVVVERSAEGGAARIVLALPASASGPPLDLP